MERTKQRPSLLWGATAAASLVAAAAAFVTMSTTNPGSEEKSRQTDEAEYKKLPMHTQVIARTNREHLRAMMKDIESGTDKARYRDLLDGKIHGTTHGTSMPHNRPN